MNNLFKLTLALALTTLTNLSYAGTITIGYSNAGNVNLTSNPVANNADTVSGGDVTSSNIDNTSADTTTAGINPTTSDGSDGALVLNDALTLNVSKNQVFNYTDINLQADSILDFSGLNSGDSVFIFGTGDIRIGGIMNLPSFTSFVFETTGNIYLDGSILTANSNLFFESNSFFSSASSLISNIAGSINLLANGGVVNINGMFKVSNSPLTPSVNNGEVTLNPPLIQIPPKTPIALIPEPGSYVLLALGLLAMAYRSKKSGC